MLTCVAEQAGIHQRLGRKSSGRSCARLLAAGDRKAAGTATVSGMLTRESFPSRTLPCGSCCSRTKGPSHCESRAKQRLSGGMLGNGKGEQGGGQRRGGLGCSTAFASWCGAATPSGSCAHCLRTSRCLSTARAALGRSSSKAHSRRSRETMFVRYLHLLWSAGGRLEPCARCDGTGRDFSSEAAARVRNSPASRRGLLGVDA